MTVCRLMVMDYLYGIGRIDPDLNTTRYDDDNLREGADYARGLQEMGYTKEPFYGFDLSRFQKWCESQ